MVSLPKCRRTVLFFFGFCPVLLSGACNGPPPGGISVSLSSPTTVQIGQTIAIAVGIFNPVIPPCAVTITKNGQTASLATFPEPGVSDIRYTIPANTPLGTYTIIGTCTGITSAPVPLIIANSPKITEYGPVPASIGMIQQIQGTGLGATQGSGTIELLQSNGGQPSTQISAVTSWSNGQITYTLPTVPAGTYQLAVHTASNGDSASVGPYTITPAVQFLWVADSLNNRVVGFPAPIMNGEPFGPAFTQIGLLRPGGVASDPSRDLLWISDTGNSRVLQMSTPGTLNETPNIILGQTLSCPSNSTAIPPATASTFCNPTGIAIDTHGNLWVADTGNNRVVEFSPPYTQGASLVIGQATLGQNKCLTSATGLCQPRGIAFDSFGNLWVADTLSNRVLEYLQPFSNGQAANFVLGQTKMTNGTPNQGYDFTQWNGLANPTGVAFDTAGGLWVADNQNDRVLEFIPTSQGTGSRNYSEFPDFVLGQISLYSGDVFSANTCLHSSIAEQTSLCEPSSVLFDNSGNLYVADMYNNRTLEYTPGNSGGAPSFSTGQAASAVVGQGGFSQKAQSSGAANLSLPTSAAWQIFRGQ